MTSNATTQAVERLNEALTNLLAGDLVAVRAPPSRLMGRWIVKENSPSRNAGEVSAATPKSAAGEVGQ